MTFTDKTLVCRDCGREFVFNAEEQEFYSGLGFGTEPSRCRSCRRRAKHLANRIVYEAICAKCGQTARLRFEPRRELPVYCHQCYTELNGCSAAYEDGSNK